MPSSPMDVLAWYIAGYNPDLRARAGMAIDGKTTIVTTRAP
ncbi:hypothetical protein ACQP2T_10415 [Nonomuraea sp. CA-143628]